MSAAVKLNGLLVATHNEGKRREFEKLLAPYVGNLYSAAQKNLPEPEETEDSFAGNAKLKALAGARASGLLTLADDSGFGLVTLNGRPGVYSARFAKTAQGHDYDDAAHRLYDEAAGAHEAFFICVLVLARPDGSMHLVEGRCDGTMIYPGRGLNGFGYDAFFLPQGHTRSFGEMAPEEKHPLSHRGKALTKLVEFFGSAAGQAFLSQ